MVPTDFDDMITRGSDILRSSYDVAYVGDFSSDDEDWTRVAEEVAFLKRHGITTCIVHLPLGAAHRTINADLASQVREGSTEPLNPRRTVVEAASVVLTTKTLRGILARRPVHHVFASQVLLLCDDILGSENWLRQVLKLMEQATELYGGSCLLSAVRPSSYRTLQAEEYPLPIAPSWHDLTAQHASSDLREGVRQIVPELPYRVGIFLDSTPSSDESTLSEACIASPDDWQFWWYGYAPAQPQNTHVEQVHIKHWEMTVGNFLSKVDAIAVFPTDGQQRPFHAAVWKALRSGLPVILPESWREDFGPGPLYRHPAELGETLRQFADQPEFREEILKKSAALAAGNDASSVHEQRQRIELLTGRSQPKPVRVRRTSRRRVLFMSTNGMGVGHLSRQIAIARKLPDALEPVFLSLSQAVPIVQQFGFHGEYFPYHLSTLSDGDDWNGWLQVTVEQILDAYSIDTVVFDGNMPYAGLCRAVSTQNGRRMVWIRRGMWRPDQNNSVSLSRSRYADLVIEPDDIASDMDTGQSADLRHEVVVVDPIRLLDDGELLTRKESCRKLGLDARKRYALIQLGARNNLNTVDLIDSIIENLRELGETQPVIAEWLNAETPLDLWPDAPRLRCFPISRYYRAFDFTISGAGYNSFNEIISFGVPSVFVPNPGTRMDDQSARATFADDHRAAIHLDSELSPMLRQVLAMIQDRSLRRNMVQSCRRLAKPNGANLAASAIAEIAGLSRSIG